MSCSLLQYPLRNCLALSLFINKKILLSDLDIDNDLNIVVYIAHQGGSTNKRNMFTYKTEM